MIVLFYQCCSLQPNRKHLKTATIANGGIPEECHPQSPYLIVHQEGWMMVSASHRVLAAPSGGVSRESPGYSKRMRC